MQILRAIKEKLQSAHLIQTPYLAEKPLQTLGFSNAIHANTILGKVKGLGSALIHTPGSVLANRKIRQENASKAKKNWWIRNITNSQVKTNQTMIKAGVFLAVAIPVGIALVSHVGKREIALASYIVRSGKDLASHVVKAGIHHASHAVRSGINFVSTLLKK
ncbi:MAG: hypothetical protein WCP39_05825 [Chlamydiota bacterium]